MSRSNSIISNAYFILSFCVFVGGIFDVERIPLRWRFVWPLSVSGDKSGRFLRTVSEVIPGHVVN